MCFKLAIYPESYQDTLSARHKIENIVFNPLKPNYTYRGRTTPLTSKGCILYIYSTNIGTEYFKYGVYYPIFLFKMKFIS